MKILISLWLSEQQPCRGFFNNYLLSGSSCLAWWNVFDVSVPNVNLRFCFYQWHFISISLPWAACAPAGKKIACNTGTWLITRLEESPWRGGYRSSITVWRIPWDRALPTWFMVSWLSQDHRTGDFHFYDAQDWKKIEGLTSLTVVWRTFAQLLSICWSSL